MTYLLGTDKHWFVADSRQGLVEALLEHLDPEVRGLLLGVLCPHHAGGIVLEHRKVSGWGRKVRILRGQIVGWLPLCPRIYMWGARHGR